MKYHAIVFLLLSLLNWKPCYALELSPASPVKVEFRVVYNAGFFITDSLTARVYPDQINFKRLKWVDFNYTLDGIPRYFSLDVKNEKYVKAHENYYLTRTPTKENFLLKLKEIPANATNLKITVGGGFVDVHKVNMSPKKVLPTLKDLGLIKSKVAPGIVAAAVLVTTPIVKSILNKTSDTDKQYPDIQELVDETTN